MRLPNLLRQGDVSFNMTPMIDVVFLLIIFFLVSSHLAKQEAQLPLPLPVARSGQSPAPDSAPRVIVNVLRDGTLLLAGHRIEADDLEQRLQARRSQDGEDLEVKIRGDRGVHYRHVQPVMLACTAVGIWNVTISVYSPEDVR